MTLAYALLRKHALLHATGQFDPNHGTIDVLRTLPFVMTFYLQETAVSRWADRALLHALCHRQDRGAGGGADHGVGSGGGGIKVLESAGRELDGCVCQLVVRCSD